MCLLENLKKFQLHSKLHLLFFTKFATNHHDQTKNLVFNLVFLAGIKNNYSLLMQQTLHGYFDLHEHLGAN